MGEVKPGQQLKLRIAQAVGKKGSPQMQWKNHQNRKSCFAIVTPMKLGVFKSCVSWCYPRRGNNSDMSIFIVENVPKSKTNAKRLTKDDAKKIDVEERTSSSTHSNHRSRCSSKVVNEAVETLTEKPNLFDQTFFCREWHRGSRKKITNFITNKGLAVIY